MKRRQRILFAFVCCLFATLFLVSCSEGTPVSSDSLTSEIPGEYFTLQSSVKIVRQADYFPPEISSAASLIKSASAQLIGQEISIKDDWYRGELIRNEFEILLGRTNRPESESVYESLAYFDYTYEVVSPGCVVICGGSDTATLQAAEKFLLDCYGYTDLETPGKLQDIAVGTSYTYRHTYPLESLQLCGKDISSFSLVHPSKKSHKTAAETLQRAISMKTGLLLPLVPAEEYRDGNAIFVGFADIDGSHLYPYYGSYNYLIQEKSVGDFSHVILDTTASIKEVTEAFCDAYLRNITETDSYSITIPQEPLILNTCPEALNGLRLVNKTDEIICDGLTYSKHTYKDTKGAPVIAYVLEADLSKVDILNGTPHGGYEIHNVKATTLEAMQSVKADGLQVLAGVNADFFRIDSDYSPQGLCIKEGRVLNQAQGDWFGITHEGQAVINNAALYKSTYKDTLKEAVGGRNIVLKNGFYNDIEIGTEFGDTRHPRTAVGIKPDGNLLFVVIDGRQPSLSNGASLADLAQIFLELGATDALNLDGGGSSSIVTLSPNGDSFITRNSPSDGKLRSVYNSLVIVKKK